MMASAGSKYDIARFGAERFSFSPRQADLMIVAGRVTYKMAPILRRIWDQMPQPKWCISMGACASSGESTRSCRSTSTVRDARRDRKASCTAS